MKAPLATSYRRRLINEEFARISLPPKGLDIGGGRRNWWWQPPSGWKTLDLTGPVDIHADICRLPLRSRSLYVVKATEVLEHVKDTPRALRECHRVLRRHGVLIISVPFLERIHADPDDYARYTKSMWDDLLYNAGFHHWTIDAHGGFGMHLAELLRQLIARSPSGLRHLLCLFLPALDVLAKWEGPQGYVGGWFIRAYV